MFSSGRNAHFLQQTGGIKYLLDPFQYIDSTFSLYLRVSTCCVTDRQNKTESGVEVECEVWTLMLEFVSVASVTVHPEW